MKLSIESLLPKMAKDAFVARGSKDLWIHRVSGITDADAYTLTFFNDEKYREDLKKSKAAAVILREPIAELTMTQIVCANPYAAFARVAMLFFKYPISQRGQSPKAWIDPEAKVDPSATLYPFVFIDKGAVIEADVVLMPGVYVGANALIGAGSLLFPQVVVMDRSIIGKNNIIHSSSVIGADGFGFAADEEEIVKIPQVGIAETADHVELGTHVSIDRATHGKTMVGAHSKFDNKVHLGHNAKVGQHCMFAAQFSVAGSSVVGDWVLGGGLSGIAGHLHVADRTKIGALTGIISATEEGKTYMGFPAIKAGEWRRQHALLRRLNDSYKKIAELESRLLQLEQKIGQVKSI